uniref:Uncharacterized protein n=1 Tax=Myotis myotis TaxID=51298 RepID=A0A7J7Z5X4_MYOMY|nr:hypothetical protein mMyoMyo1_010693 [Myotis myotis]
MLILSGPAGLFYFFEVFRKALLQVPGSGRSWTRTPLHIFTCPYPSLALGAGWRVGCDTSKRAGKNEGPSAKATLYCHQHHYYYPIHCWALDLLGGDHQTPCPACSQQEALQAQIHWLGQPEGQQGVFRGRPPQASHMRAEGET